MNSNKSLAVIVLLLALLAGFGGYSLHQQAPTAPKAGEIGSSIPGPLTSTFATVTGASTVILATSSARQYAAVVNDGTNNVYLSIGNNAVAGSGILLTPGGSYEITNQNLITGSIRGITSTGSSNVTVIYK